MSRRSTHTPFFYERNKKNLELYYKVQGIFKKAYDDKMKSTISDHVFTTQPTYEIRWRKI